MLSNKEALATRSAPCPTPTPPIAMTECTANKVTTTIKGTLCQAVEYHYDVRSLNVTVIGYN